MRALILNISDFAGYRGSEEGDEDLVRERPPPVPREGLSNWLEPFCLNRSKIQTKRPVV